MAPFIQEFGIVKKVFVKNEPVLGDSLALSVGLVVQGSAGPHRGPTD